MGAFMSFLPKIFKRSKSLAETNLQSPLGWLLNMFNPSKTGVRVTELSAMRASAVFACVRVLAETVASLPLITYQKTDAGKDRASNHPVYKLLKDRPNPEITSYTWRNMAMAHMNLWGESFAKIDFNNAGYPSEIWPLLPSKMDIRRNMKTLELEYLYTKPDGGLALFAPWEILHLKMMTLDGVRGISPIGMAKEAIGLSLAQEEFGARFYGNGTNMGGFFKTPNKLSEPAHKRLKKNLEEQYTGLTKSHKIAILEEGLDFIKLGIPPNEAQFLESRKFQLNEICRMFRVQSHLVNDLDRSTNNNIEQQSLEFIIYTIRPWLVNIEQEYNYKLFTPAEQNSYFTEHLVDGILRGDLESRYRAYQTGRLGGWLSVNKILEKENENKIEGGDVYLDPLNMIPAKLLEDYFKNVINKNITGGNQNAK
jgi:HK97 family phage portal protein